MGERTGEGARLRWQKAPAGWVSEDGRYSVWPNGRQSDGHRDWSARRNSPDPHAGGGGRAIANHRISGNYFYFADKSSAQAACAEDAAAERSGT